MKIYIVIIEDRHIDVVAYPFANATLAISEAKRKAKEFCRFPEDYSEHDYGKDAGWLFYANCSCEGDSVKVITTELDKKI